MESKTNHPLRIEHNLGYVDMIKQYTDLLNGIAFHIHEVANGGKWNHLKWMNTVILPLKQYSALNNVELAHILDIEIKTLLGDTFCLTRYKEGLYLVKFINGKRVNQFEDANGIIN